MPLYVREREEKEPFLCECYTVGKKGEKNSSLLSRFKAKKTHQTLDLHKIKCSIHSFYQ